MLCCVPSSLFVFAKITNHSIKRCTHITVFINVITVVWQDGEPNGPDMAGKPNESWRRILWFY